jgi:hypothetical protein
VLELELSLSADEALEACRRRGIVVRSERELACRAGGRHWHLHAPGRRGTLELSEAARELAAGHLSGSDVSGV